MQMNFGGHRFIKVDGYGRFGLGVIRALLQDGHDIHPFILDDMEFPTWYRQAQGLDFGCATVQLSPPHNMYHLPGRSAAWTMHESSALPEGWSDHINQKNQLCIVPSPWLIAVMEEAGVKVPIKVVPGGIDPEETPILRRSKSGPYTFIALADRGNRKGHHETYQAFYKAFAHTNKDVRLILKCRPGSLSSLDFSYSTDSRLTIWREDVERISDVFAVADAAINPIHCEGFGMWPREAAACGLPALVTRWSGTADDCDKWAIPLEKYTLIDSHMQGCGGQWAQPDIDEIAWRMRDMYEKQDEYKAQALKAAAWMRANMTYAHAAQKLLGVMAWWLGGPPPAEEDVHLLTKAVTHTNGKHKEAVAL